MLTSLHIMVECTGRRVTAFTPLGQPVVGNEMTAAWKQLIKHLSVVVGFFGVWNNTFELCVSLSKHLLINLRIAVIHVQCYNTRICTKKNNLTIRTYIPHQQLWQVIAVYV